MIIQFIQKAADMVANGNDSPIIIRHMMHIQPVDVIRYYSSNNGQQQTGTRIWGNDKIVDIWARELMEIDNQMLLNNHLRNKTFSSKQFMLYFL
jgi:alanine racemase